MSAPPALCIRCAGDKDLALGRCGACGYLPGVETGTDDDLVVSLCASQRLLTPEALLAARERMLRGEPLAPGPALRARAHGILRGAPEEEPALSRGRLLALGAVSLVVTPLLAWAAWFRWRARGGAAAGQAFRVALWTSAASLGAWMAWVRAAV
jgi:hypothetical protein